MSGARSYHAGLAAEDSVAQRYARAGHQVAARRWRGKSGEVDLIARDGDVVIFIEVKQSRTHADAAEEFIGDEPNGSLTDVRFDVALVDGKGVIEILENAYAA
jgi:putative endonuclease